MAFSPYKFMKRRGAQIMKRIKALAFLLAFIFIYASLCQNFGGALNENNREGREVH